MDIKERKEKLCFTQTHFGSTSVLLLDSVNDVIKNKEFRLYLQSKEYVLQK